MATSPHVTRAHSDTPPESNAGFSIQLHSAQLGDLIQINCVNRVRGAFRVSSGEREGVLFFAEGQLVHATCPGQVGLDAVVSMLGWRGGSITPTLQPWPSEATIGMGADELLLSAAQVIDERARRAPEPGAAPRAEVTTQVVRRVEWPGPVEPLHPAEDSARGAARTPAPDTEPRAPRPTEHSALVLKSALSVESLSRLEVARVTPDGDIQRSRAGASTDLADTAFFCQRVASLIGEGLGLGACRALACESAREGVVVFQGRTIVGTRGQRRDLEVVLAKVGLD